MAIVTHYTAWNQPVNFDLLHQELKAELGEVFVGLLGDGKHIGACFDDAVEPVDQALLARAAAVLQAHDWTKLSDVQKEVENGMLSAEQLMSEIDNRIAWHEANPVNGSNAIQVAKRLQTEWLYFLKMLRSGIVRLG